MPALLPDALRAFELQVMMGLMDVSAFSRAREE